MVEKRRRRGETRKNKNNQTQRKAIPIRRKCLTSILILSTIDYGWMSLGCVQDGNQASHTLSDKHQPASFGGCSKKWTKKGAVRFHFKTWNTSRYKHSFQKEASKTTVNVRNMIMFGYYKVWKKILIKNLVLGNVVSFFFLWTKNQNMIGMKVWCFMDYHE